MFSTGVLKVVMDYHYHLDGQRGSGYNSGMDKKPKKSKAADITKAGNESNPVPLKAKPFYSQNKGYTVNRKRGKLTPKQKVFVEAVPVIGQTEAAKLAYPDATAREAVVIGSANMSKPLVSSSIAEVSNRIGLTKDKCVVTILDGLDADNETVDQFGRPHASPDHRTRLKAAELGLRLHGELKSDHTTIMPVPVSKEAYIGLCQEFWKSKPI